MSFFDINYIVFEVIGYPVSYIELIGTFFGLLSVYFASRTNILTWPTGIINELFLFILFFQIHLYADMFLQIYFFVVTLYGWYTWRKTTRIQNITSSNFRSSIYLSIIIITGTVFSGILFSSIHLYLPQYFETKASFPFTDSFIMTLSIVATVLLARKKIETWYLWIIVDIVCIFLFFKKGIIFLSLEYLIFLGLAIYGLLNWKKQLKQ